MGFGDQCTNWNIYGGAGAGGSFPIGASISVVAGWIQYDVNPYRTQAELTDNFLSGASQNYSGGVPVMGVPVVVGGTSVWAADQARWFNSIEGGIGTPGVGANYVYSSKIGSVDNLVRNLIESLNVIFPATSDPSYPSYYMVPGAGLAVGDVPSDYVFQGLTTDLSGKIYPLYSPPEVANSYYVPGVGIKYGTIPSDYIFQGFYHDSNDNIYASYSPASSPAISGITVTNTTNITTPSQSNATGENQAQNSVTQGIVYSDASTIISTTNPAGLNESTSLTDGVANSILSGGIMPGNMNQTDEYSFSLPSWETVMQQMGIGTYANNYGNASYFPVDPLVLDLNGDGVKLTDYMSSPVLFDADHDGKLEQTGWDQIAC